MNKVPRSRSAAEQQAQALMHQLIVGWGADHPFVKDAEVLHEKITAANKVYSPVPEEVVE